MRVEYDELRYPFSIFPKMSLHTLSWLVRVRVWVFFRISIESARAKMGIHQRLAENLREMCYRHASIAEVCRGIGINRQQFNKYLGGQSVPNAATLRRICDYLGVAEEHLLLSSQIQQHQSIKNLPNKFGQQVNQLAPLLRQLVDSSQGGLGSAKDSIQPGAYYCYFPLQGSRNFLLRSLISVQCLNDAVTFTRRTIFRSESGSHKYLARGKHVGHVLAGAHEIYFLGVNKLPPRQLSYMAIDRDSATSKILTGMATTRTSTGQVAARISLQYLGRSIAARDVLRSLGPISVDSSALEPFIRISMTLGHSSFNNHVSAVSLDELALSVCGDPVRLTATLATD